MLQFDEGTMPKRVYIGYVSYAVRAYVHLQSGVSNVKNMGMLRQSVRENSDVVDVVGTMNMESVSKGHI